MKRTPNLFCLDIVRAMDDEILVKSGFFKGSGFPRQTSPSHPTWRVFHPHNIRWIAVSSASQCSSSHQQGLTRLLTLQVNWPQTSLKP
eukprot:355915-Chlamydomonas_euryale.AAC.10